MLPMQTSQDGNTRQWIMQPSDCDHIVGSNETIGGDWLIFKSDKRLRIDRVFIYCPLCGEKLQEEYEEMTHA